MLDKLLQTIRHNQTVFCSAILCLTLTIWCYSCEPVTRSPRDHSKKVTRAELDIDVKIYAEEVALAYTDLQKQEQIREAILNAGLAYVQGQGVSLIGIIATLSSIVGIGAIIDNRKKDAIIKTKTNALNSLYTIAEKQ
mgnify:CR=1 FL=1